MGDKSHVKDFPFEDEVRDMGDFIVEHQEILGSNVDILARELQVPTKAGQKRLDFLAFDKDSNQVNIIELKNSIADEKVLLQTLRYANWIRNNPDTVRYHIKRNNLEIDTEIVDTDSIKVIIIAPKIAQTLTELCQYINTFDFEFVQLQRFKDSQNKVYALTDRLEPDKIEPVDTRFQHIYDLDWYRNQSVSEAQIKDLQNAIDKLSEICEQNSWDLGVRYVKWAIRFQTSNGHNVFFILVRKTINHLLSLALGENCDLSKLDIPGSIRKRIKQKSNARWWEIDLKIEEIESLIPLLNTAYQNITK